MIWQCYYYYYCIKCKNERFPNNENESPTNMCIMYSTYLSWYSCASAILALSLWSSSCSIKEGFNPRRSKLPSLETGASWEYKFVYPWKWWKMSLLFTYFQLSWHKHIMGLSLLVLPMFGFGLVKSPQGERKTSKVSSSFWGWLPYELGMIRLPVVISDLFLWFSGFWRWNWRFAILKGLPFKRSQTTLASSCLILLANDLCDTHTIGNVCGFSFNDTIHDPFMYKPYIYIFVKHIYIISSIPSINEHHVLSRFFCQRRWTRFTLRPKLVNLSSNMLSFETFSVVDRQEESPMTDASSSKTTDREENGRDTIRRIDSLESF